MVKKVKLYRTKTILTFFSETRCISNHNRCNLFLAIALYTNTEDPEHLIR